jgi:hypothetical protein
MYSIANIIGILLFWLYKRRDKKKKPSEANVAENEIFRKRREEEEKNKYNTYSLSCYVAT